MTINIQNGSRIARIVSNYSDGPFTTTLWVNNGETITRMRAKAQTLAGARKQADKMLKQAAHVHDYTLDSNDTLVCSCGHRTGL